MTDPYLPLDSLSIHTPDLSALIEFLEEEGDSQHPAISEWAKCAYKWARILEEASEGWPVPERLGWLLLWSGGFQIVLSRRENAREGSHLGDLILDRSRFELGLILNVILQPGRDAMWPREIRFSQVRARLRAYVAHCLQQDRSLLEEERHRLTLRGAFDPTLARDLVRDLDASRDRWEAFFGEIETFTDAEAELERKEHAERLDGELDWIREMLTDDRLRDWRREDDDQISSFFQLVDPNLRSVADVLKSFEMRWAYSTFKRGSAAAHLTTFSNIFVREGSIVMVPGPQPPSLADARAQRQADSATILLGQLWALGGVINKSLRE